MSAAPKTNRESVSEEMHERTAVRDEAAALFLRGIERIAEVQKQCIDVALQQNAEMLEIWKKATDNLPGMPKLPMLDLTHGAMNRYADVQKAAIEFLAEQGRIWTDVLKDRTSTAKKSSDSTTNVTKQTLEQSFAVQKKALEHTAAQTKAVVDATRRQFGMTGAQADALTDTFRRSVDTVVDAQKELLDLVTH